MTNANGLVDHVDVLIIGAGPAGMMLANWMSRCGIKTRIVDKRGTKVFPSLLLLYGTHKTRSSMVKLMGYNAEHSRSSILSALATGSGVNLTI